MDPDKAFAIQIAHEESVLATQTAYVQCALLYTSSNGERRIRCAAAIPLRAAAGQQEKICHNSHKMCPDILLSRGYRYGAPQQQPAQSNTAAGCVHAGQQRRLQQTTRAYACAVLALSVQPGNAAHLSIPCGCRLSEACPPCNAAGCTRWRRRWWATWWICTGA